MASHAIFRYNVLAIDDTHNTCTNICVKMIIIRFIGPSDEKIKDPKETKSKRSEQRQFTIIGWTDDRKIVLTDATDSEKAKSAEYTGWTDVGFWSVGAVVQRLHFWGFLRLHAPVEPTLVLRASVDWRLHASVEPMLVLRASVDWSK